MTFVWPLALLSLLVVPLLLGMYWWSQRRRRKQAVRYSSVALLRSVLPRRKRWQRHLPIALLLAALVALGISAGRPHVVREVPIARTSIILALDVSRSMCSTDVKPNRLAVAQEAARAFVQKQPEGIRMGLVVFSGFAELIVPPTTDRKALVEAIDGLTTGHGTAIGSAMLKGLDAIAEANPNVAPVGDAPETEPPATRLEPRPARRPTASCRTSSCCSPTAPTTAASSRSMRFPTRSSAGCACIRSASAPPTRRRRRAPVQQLGGDVFDAGGFGGGGGGLRRWFGGRRGFLVADEPTLKEVAKQTGGTYHGAKDADQLSKVFADLPKEVATQKQPTEITWMLAALGALLAAAAVAASMRWSPYP